MDLMFMDNDCYMMMINSPINITDQLIKQFYIVNRIKSTILVCKYIPKIEI
nr:hypothetical protein CJLB15_00018 [Campylobacter phage CJLB-15]